MPKKYRIMKEFQIGEISAVDRPAQSHARMSIMKRAVTADAIAKYVGPMIDGVAVPGAKTFDEIYRQAEEQRRQWQANEALWPLFSALEDSLRSIAADATLTAAAKVSKIEASITAFMAAIKAELPDVEQELGKVLREQIASARKAAGLPADEPRETTMPDDAKKISDLEKSVADLTAALAAEKDKTAKAEAAKAQAETVAKFSTDEREFFEKADDKGKAEFLADKPEARAAKVALAKSSDETFKMADGTTIRKSEVGAPAFAVMKSQEARIAKQAEDLAKSNDAVALAGFTKRATDEMAHLPGEVVAKAALLKAIDGIGEEEKKTLKAIVDAGEKMAKAGFDKIGRGGDPEKGSAKAEATAKAAEIRKSDAKLTEDQAMAKVYADNPTLADRVAAEEAPARAN